MRSEERKRKEIEMKGQEMRLGENKRKRERTRDKKCGENNGKKRSEKKVRRAERE